MEARPAEHVEPALPAAGWRRWGSTHQRGQLRRRRAHLRAPPSGCRAVFCWRWRRCKAPPPTHAGRQPGCRAPRRTPLGRARRAPGQGGRGKLVPRHGPRHRLQHTPEHADCRDQRLLCLRQSLGVSLALRGQSPSVAQHGLCSTMQVSPRYVEITQDLRVTQEAVGHTSAAWGVCRISTLWRVPATLYG